jgi:hypothetical protein
MGRIGRPRKNPIENAETPAPEPAKQTVRRGRKPKAEAPAVNETAILLDVVLKSRGTKGATPEILHSVMAWARGIREEETALRTLIEHPRRQKTEAPTDRIARHSTNQALLDGVLAGTILLDVLDNGDLVFHHATATTPAPTTVEPSVAALAEIE